MERRHCGPPSCPPRGRGKYLLPSDKLQRLARDQSSHTRLFLILMKKICTRQEDEQRSFAVRGSRENEWAMYCAVLWAVGGLGWARMRLRRIHRPRSERNSAVPKLTAQGQSLRRAIDAVPTRMALACLPRCAVRGARAGVRPAGHVLQVLLCFPAPRLGRPGDGGDSRMGVSEAGEPHDGNPPRCKSVTVYAPAPAARRGGQD